MNSNIGISNNQLQAEAQELNKFLADEFILYTKTRNYHWNIVGSNFMELHKLYESQFEQLNGIIDEVAERIRTLGHYATARLKDYLKLTHLMEQEYINNQDEQLQNLLTDHEIIIQGLRVFIIKFAKKNRDFGTSDFVTGIMERHEKMAWLIRSYIKQ